MLVGIFNSAGYDDLVLQRLDDSDEAIVYASGALRANALQILPLMNRGRLMWSKRRHCAQEAIQPIAAIAESEMINRIALAAREAIERGAPTVSLQEAARLACRSTRSVQRDLSSAWTTLRDIRTAVRMQRATSLLAGNHSLGDIAFASGFSDAPHLVREFKRIVGLTPERCRMLFHL
jgi:AraC-like DNA-binding protein